MTQLLKLLWPCRLPHLAMLAAAGCLMVTADGLAASSAWVETEGGRIRITALPPSSDGVIRAILDVDLLPGWKTYWRDPGDAGIPPSVNFEGSTNIEQLRLDFPPPERVDDGYSVWAGYTYPVAFPLTLTQDKAGAASVLEAQVFLGICKTICIPVQNSFSLTVDPNAKANSFEQRIVDKAYSQIPEQAGHDISIRELTFLMRDQALSVSIAHPDTMSDLDLFLTAPSGWYFDIPERVGGNDGVSQFNISVIDAPGEKSLSGTELQILVTSPTRSMETISKVP